MEPLAGTSLQENKILSSREKLVWIGRGDRFKAQGMSNSYT